ncbi:MAG: hypothetical protein AAGI70_05725 [Pseudomonadota bacterium]
MTWADFRTVQAIVDMRAVAEGFEGDAKACAEPEAPDFAAAIAILLDRTLIGKGDPEGAWLNIDRRRVLAALLEQARKLTMSDLSHMAHADDCKDADRYREALNVVLSTDQFGAENPGSPRK